MILRGSAPFEWAVGIIQREIEQDLFGTLSFTFQKGLIVACKVEKSEKPPLVASPTGAIDCSGKKR